MKPNIRDHAAIDIHAHYGTYTRDHMPELANSWMSGDAEAVAHRALAANIRWTVASPLTALLPRFKADATVGNDEAWQVVPPTQGLLWWVVIDPLREETYAQAELHLQEAKCAGIKIHPEEHGYPIREHGDKIFEFAARHNAFVLTHSGEENSLPADFVPYVNRYPDITLIVAHLGHGLEFDNTLQVRAIQQSQHGNLYVDTSSSNSIKPGLIEWAVAEVGVERVLFGTDTPLYFAAMQRARIEFSELTYDQKKQILWDNSARLLKQHVNVDL
jgi:predicted TIM-barrel fold metal-dependent hydrolase